MKSALVTGTSGFVGGAIGRHLRQLGWHVTGISRSPARPGAVDTDYRHDLSQPIPAQLQRHDVVIHAAALASPWSRPADFTRHIVDTTGTVLDFAERTGPDGFVHISTSAVFYEDCDQYGLTETSPWPAKPINEYARAKRQAEQLVERRRPQSLILRPRAVYGPGDTVLFPRILRIARAGFLPRIMRADGASPLADLIYIGNLVHAVATAIEREVTGAINITDGAPVRVHDMLLDILARLGCRPRILPVPFGAAMMAAGAMEWLSANLAGWREPPLTRFGVSAIGHSKTFDVQRMLSLLGPPPHTTADGIAAFVDWHKSSSPP